MVRPGRSGREGLAHQGDRPAQRRPLRIRRAWPRRPEPLPWRAHGGPAADRPWGCDPAVRGGAPHEPVVRPGRAARQRDCLASRGRVRRGDVAIAQRRPEAPGDGPLRPCGEGHGSGHEESVAQPRAGAGAAAVPPGNRVDGAAAAPGDEADDGFAPPPPGHKAAPWGGEAIAPEARRRGMKAAPPGAGAKAAARPLRGEAEAARQPSRRRSAGAARLARRSDRLRSL
jgi:hypothetical protein